MTEPDKEIDQLLTVAQPKSWLLLGSIAALVFGLLVWSFLGKIPTEVTGRGVALSPGGVFSIEARAGGTISELFVKEGAMIEKATAIATIYNPMRRAYLTTILHTRKKIALLYSERQMLQERLNTQLALFDEGLVPKSFIEESRLAISAKRIAIEEAEAAIASTFSKLEEISFQDHDAFEAILQELAQAKGEAELEKFDDMLATVFSPAEGKVLEVLVNVGDTVGVKEPLVWMERVEGVGQPPVFLCCIPVQEKDYLRAGLSVRIEPMIVNAQEYGSIVGTVREVSPYVVSEEELISELHNKQLVDFLTGGAPAVMQITVEPKLDPSTPSGFVWTSREGPPYPIPNGTLCVVKVVVEEQSPISYLIPVWKLSW